MRLFYELILATRFITSLRCSAGLIRALTAWYKLPPGTACEVKKDIIPLQSGVVAFLVLAIALECGLHHIFAT